MGEAFLRSAICLVLRRDTGEDGTDKATRDAKGIDGLAANRLEGGERLQRPDVGVQGAIPLVFYMDAKAEDVDRGLSRDIAGMPGALVLARSGEGLGTLGFCQRGYEEGYCRPRAPCYPDTGEALGPRQTDEADHSGSYQRIYGQPVQ